eukprot:gnl/TRDRNA2_/TRDRNA2_119907_c2_seq1.p1 gnl/TRDRNA2_/TRDRNA2_119907_c2~~gnl/TRDRNA2_/TRDRNA2_119907_c2_seq1.p1  ORF type:complete len:564 (+),score=46.97 gnl/TRDRNA2_/TRDRNA2_119907_c2_seq1:1-1692(+)
MVTVLGGHIGVDCSGTMNSPTLTGLHLLGQTEAALVYDGGLEAASAVGLIIRPASSHAVAFRSGAPSSIWGQISVIDSVVDYPVTDTDGCVAFDVSHSIYLRNVYIRNCGNFVRATAHNVNITIPASAALGGHWNRANEVMVGADIIRPASNCKPASMPIYRDGQRRTVAWETSIDYETAAPPDDLSSRHAWGEATFPTWDGPAVVDATEKPFGAVGDGSTDDTDAIQRAIDEAPDGGAVFLPVGAYRISRTLNLTGTKGAASLIGAARHLTRIMPLSDGLTGMAPGKPAPLVHFEESVAYAVFSMLTLVTWEHLDSVYGLQWDNHHPRSTYRQSYIYRITECLYGFPRPKPIPVREPTMFCKPLANLSHPLNVITGSIMAYNFENEDFYYETPPYRHMLVRGNLPSDNVAFYQANFEHANSEANMEIADAHNVVVYSFKTEGEWRDIMRGGLHNPGVAVWIRNSTNVSIYSHGGNARAMASGSHYPHGYTQYPPTLYRIEDSCPVRLTNLVDQFQFQPDDDWNFIYDNYRGNTTLTSHCDRPVLYARATCSDQQAKASMLFV